jgi:tRNA A64-2'-O-ribosylphosphate transferase
MNRGDKSWFQRAHWVENELNSGSESYYDDEKEFSGDEEEVFNIDHESIFEESVKFHKLVRQIKVCSDNIQFRLKSIQYDSYFIQKLKNECSCLEMFANLRCGQWYAPSFSDTCYFKSTDGHYGQWSFSNTRLNLNVLISSYKNAGSIIVDSTRKGKHYSDALSKTIPIWVTVMNRLIHRSFSQTPDNLPGLQLPSWLSKSEASQIGARIESFVQSACEDTIDWNEFFLERYYDIFHNKRHSDGRIKYMKCFWVHQGTDFHLSKLAKSDDSIDFIPIICASASDPFFPEKSYSWTYIQGAGDDQESWSHGLNPQLFYDHIDYILENNITVEETERRVDEIVLKYKQTTQPINKNTNEFMIAIGNDTTRLYLGRNSDIDNNLPSDFAAIKCKLPDCSDKEAKKLTDSILELPIVDHRKYKNCLEEQLPVAISFAHEQLEKGKKLLIADETGQKESVALLVGIMCALFSDDKNMDIYTGKNHNVPKLGKKQIRKRLSHIQSYQSNVNPSRNLMKQLNRYFIR